MTEQSFDRQYLQFVDERIRWNKRTADRTMVQFVTVRFSLVLVSAALPALTTLEPRLWAVLASVIVAALAGLDTQFQWGDEWRHFRSTQLGLERALRDYNQRLAELSDSSSRERVKAKQDSFDTFYKDVENLLQKETDQFFKFRITPWKRRVAD